MGRAPAFVVTASGEGWGEEGEGDGSASGVGARVWEGEDRGAPGQQLECSREERGDEKRENESRWELESRAEGPAARTRVTAPAPSTNV